MTLDPSGLHVATIPHGGRLWSVWLELDDDPHRPEVFRGRLRFDAVDVRQGETPVRTTIILIEDSYEAVSERARRMDERQLQGLLRSALPGA